MPKERTLQMLVCVTVCLYVRWGQYVNLYKRGREISEHESDLASSHKHIRTFLPKKCSPLFCFKSDSLLASSGRPAGG